MNKTKIEWTKGPNGEQGYTWNPVTGCKHGCSYCYAERISKRFTGGFDPKFHENRLGEPAKLKKSSRIFVVSMGDLFGEWVPDDWIKRVLDACQQAQQHTYLFLTKNPKGYSGRRYTSNMWLGNTITKQSEVLEEIGVPHGAKRFYSIEPLLGEINMPQPRIAKWVIVGAQTGPGAVEPRPEWVQGIIEQCRGTNVPIFLKDNLGWHEEIKEFPLREEG